MLEDNHHRFACGPNICMERCVWLWCLNTQNAQLWCGTCLENRKVPTQSEVHEAYYICWFRSPSWTHTMCSYRNTKKKESSLMVKLINLSRCRSKWCMHRRWPRGPIDGSVTCEWPRITTACMHLSQRGVMCCLNSQCTTLMCHVPWKSKTPDTEWGVFTDKYVVYMLVPSHLFDAYYILPQ